MTQFKIIFFIFICPLYLYSQSGQIDSVVIRYCKSNPNDYSTIVDSFNVNDLLVNTTYYADTLTTIGSQESHSYSVTFKRTSSIYRNFLNPGWSTSLTQHWQYDIHDNEL